MLYCWSISATALLVCAFALSLSRPSIAPHFQIKSINVPGNFDSLVIPNTSVERLVFPQKSCTMVSPLCAFSLSKKVSVDTSSLSLQGRNPGKRLLKCCPIGNRVTLWANCVVAEIVFLMISIGFFHAN